MARDSSAETEEEISKKDVQDETENDEEVDEEYEIEEVLDAKRGVFPDGRMGYYVKWKGYAEGDNSWVDEVDAENAKELVEEYWRKHPQKKRITNRKSMEKRPTKKALAPTPSRDESDTGSVPAKKRGRKSSTKQESDDEMNVDEPDDRPNKKKKASKPRTETPEDEDDKGTLIKTMDGYMNVKSWEHLVQGVDTVEKDDEGVLWIYFTLTSGDAVRERSTVCKERFPRKLLDFYEANLRWRIAQEVD